MSELMVNTVELLAVFIGKHIVLFLCFGCRFLEIFCLLEEHIHRETSAGVGVVCVSPDSGGIVSRDAAGTGAETGPIDGN